MGKKRNGFRQKIRDSLPESLVTLLKKHKCLTAFTNKCEGYYASYINKSSVLEYDVTLFNKKDTRNRSIFISILMKINKSYVVYEVMKLD